MYVERLAASPSGYEREVIFFQPPVFRPHSIQGEFLPDNITLVRRNIMNPDQNLEGNPLPQPEKQPDIFTHTTEALQNLYKKTVFQKNGLIAGSCLRQLSLLDVRMDPAPSTVVASIKSVAISEVDPRDALGNRFHKVEYNDNFSAVNALANLRQATGTLETGDPAADSKMTEQFRNINGQLFDLNRAGGNNTVLEDLQLAVLLKQAFPDQADQIDVKDVYYQSSIAIKGQAIEIANKYLQRAIEGKLFNVPAMNKAPLAIDTGWTNLTQMRPRYLTEQISVYQMSLGSSALAAVGILRFLSEFDPDFKQIDKSKLTVLDKAEEDLTNFKQSHPDAFDDPNILLIFGEHLANIHSIRKSLSKTDSQNTLLAKSA